MVTPRHVEPQTHGSGNRLSRLPATKVAMTLFFGRLARWFGLTMGIVVVVSLLAAPPSVEGRTTPYRAGGRITLDTNLLSKSGLSAWAIDEYLASTTSLPNLGSAFLDAERKYGVNARFLIAAALHESNWGASYIAQNKHNLFGYNAYDHCRSTCASDFDSYAKGIDGVASFMKRAYLVSSGRWWGGSPTLRAMQKRWSSSGTWGVSVSRIANGLDFSSLRDRNIKFAAPSARGALHSEGEASFDLDWKGNLPSGITFVATWTPVLLDREVEMLKPVEAPVIENPSDIAQSDGPAIEPAATPTATAPIVTPEPFTTKADEKSISASKVRLDVKTPAEPGVYLVTFEARDRDGFTLPAADHTHVPSIETRLWAPHSVGYSVEASGDGSSAAVTVTNMGSAAIPAIDPNAPPAKSPQPIAIEPTGDIAPATEPVPAPTVTRFIVRAFGAGLLDPTGNILVDILLTEDLAPGASVTAVIPNTSTVTGSPSKYLVAELRVLDDPTYLAATPAKGFFYPVAPPMIPKQDSIGSPAR